MSEVGRNCITMFTRLVYTFVRVRACPELGAVGVPRAGDKGGDERRPCPEKTVYMYFGCRVLVCGTTLQHRVSTTVVVDWALDCGRTTQRASGTRRTCCSADCCLRVATND
jgi:hypothetical protein